MYLINFISKNVGFGYSLLKWNMAEQAVENFLSQYLTAVNQVLQWIKMWCFDN